MIAKKKETLGEAKHNEEYMRHTINEYGMETNQ